MQGSCSSQILLPHYSQLHQRRISMNNALFKFSAIIWISLLQQGVSLNSHDQKEYIGRSVYYWKKTLLSLRTIKKHRSIPEPAYPLFRHFHSVDIQVLRDYSKMRVRGVVCHRLTYELLAGWFVFCFSWLCVLMGCGWFCSFCFFCHCTANTQIW